LFFVGSACREGQGVGIVLISPRGAVFEQSVRLEYFYMNNQAEYEAIMLGLQLLSSIGRKAHRSIWRFIVNRATNCWHFPMSRRVFECIS
jgi:ribonuclease HI